MVNSCFNVDFQVMVFLLDYTVYIKAKYVWICIRPIFPSRCSPRAWRAIHYCLDLSVLFKVKMAPRQNVSVLCVLPGVAEGGGVPEPHWVSQALHPHSWGATLLSTVNCDPQSAPAPPGPPPEPWLPLPYYLRLRFRGLSLPAVLVTAVR